MWANCSNTGPRPGKIWFLESQRTLSHWMSPEPAWFGVWNGSHLIFSFISTTTDICWGAPNSLSPHPWGSIVKPVCVASPMKPMNSHKCELPAPSLWLGEASGEMGAQFKWRKEGEMPSKAVGPMSGGGKLGPHEAAGAREPGGQKIIWNAGPLLGSSCTQVKCENNWMHQYNNSVVAKVGREHQMPRREWPRPGTRIPSGNRWDTMLWSGSPEDRSLIGMSTELQTWCFLGP